MKSYLKHNPQSKYSENMLFIKCQMIINSKYIFTSTLTKPIVTKYSTQLIQVVENKI